MYAQGIYALIFLFYQKSLHISHRQRIFPHDRVSSQGFTFFLLYYERYYQYMCNEIEYEMIIEMLQKAKQKEQKKVEKPIEILVN